MLIDTHTSIPSALSDAMLIDTHDMNVSGLCLTSDPAAQYPTMSSNEVMSVESEMMAQMSPHSKLSTQGSQD